MNKDDLLTMSAQFPSVLAIPLKEYAEEVSPVLRLLFMSEFLELFLKFSVIICLSEIVNDEGLLPDELLGELRSRIEEPTLGKWKGMAESLSNYKKDYRIMPQLKKVIKTSVIPFLDGEDKTIKNEQNAFSQLRNRLAHGGITQKVAEKLLEQWNPKFLALINSISFIKEVTLIGLDKLGVLRKLCGYEKNPKQFESEFPDVEDLLREKLSQEKNIAALYNRIIITLDPLTLYSDALKSSIEEKCTEELQHIFSRRDEFSLNYTPIGSWESCQTHSNDNHLDIFKRLFKLDEYSPPKNSNNYYIRDFDEELKRDQGRLVGRTAELAVILKAVENNKDSILWITGSAGMGKSYVMASAAGILEENLKETASVYFYRFRAGDDRCSRKDFYRFIIERLNNNKYINKREELHKINDLVSFLSDQIKSIDKSHRLIILLDGMDELSMDGPDLVADIMNKLKLNGITWICAGRTTPALSTFFSPDRSLHLFPEGLPGMIKEDIRGMIMDKIGPLKKKLLQKDEEKEDKIVNPFIDKVCENADGLPLYVTYLLGDILSNRITSFDEEQKLPPSVQNYYEETINRYSIGIHQQILTPIISFISIAKEPLSIDTICSYLIKEDFILEDEKTLRTIKDCLRTISSLLSKTSSADNKEGYTVYHHTFREFMQKNSETKDTLIITNRRLIKLLFSCDDPPSAIDIYLFRWGIPHFRENPIDKELKNLKKLLSDEDYLSEKINYQKIENFIDDIYFSYNIIAQKDGSSPSKISEAFIKCIGNIQKNSESTLNVDTIHNLMVFRKDLTLYSEILQLGTENNYIPEKDKVILRGKLANLLRRKGQLDQSLKLLKSCIKTLEEEGKNFIELARLEYDVAYINHLKGFAKEAFNVFEKSARHALSGSDIVGYWISKCVQSSTGFHNKLVPLPEFQKILDEALPVFIEQFKVNANENARRWIMNVWSNKFEAAYYSKDLTLAKKCWKEIKENEWIKATERDDLLATYIGRLNVLEGDYSSAIKQFKLHLDANGPNPDFGLWTESLAKEYLEYGRTLLLLGDKVEAKRIFEIGLNCPPNNGNLFFQMEITQCLNNLI